MKEHKLRNLAILSDENIHTIEIRFNENGVPYTYLAHKNWNIQVGDLVYVQSSNSNKFQMVEVVTVDEEADIDVTKDIKYIFCNGRAVDFQTEREEGLNNMMTKLRREQNKVYRAQLRQELKDSLTLEASDER